MTMTAAMVSRTNEATNILRRYRGWLTGRRGAGLVDGLDARADFATDAVALDPFDIALRRRRSLAGRVCGLGFAGIG